jgi:cytochrome c551
VVGVAAGCGTQGVSVPSSDPTHAGAEIFAQRCGGCHTLSPAGTEGSANRSERQQGPNLDQRRETMADVIYAIRNGGFSGAIMPQNIVVGADAQKVAAFVSKYAGENVFNSPGPPQATAGPPGSTTSATTP